MPTQSDVEALILEAVRDLNQEWQLPALQQPDSETPLWGTRSGVDSIALVTLVAELECRVEERFGISVILADERAMSQSRSPFLRVRSLTTFLARRLGEIPATASPTEPRA